MKNLTSLISLNVYELFDEEGTAALRTRLLSLSISELKAIIAREHFDTAKMTRSWKDTERLSNFILKRTHSQVTHGDAFRDTPRYLDNPKYELN